MKVGKSYGKGHVKRDAKVAFAALLGAKMLIALETLTAAEFPPPQQAVSASTVATNAT